MKRRTIDELVKMEEELFEKVWHHRYTMSQYRNRKEHKRAFKEENHPGFPAAQKIISKYGIENLGPYTDFELGVLNGKLAAIRWALGDEEDNYDT